MTDAFLAALGLERATFQLFPDKDTGPYPRILHGPHRAVKSRLEALNREGAGVFVMVKIVSRTENMLKYTSQPERVSPPPARRNQTVREWFRMSIVREKWCPVTGFEGCYSVSNLGNVRREKGGKGSRVGVLAGAITQYGYRQFILCDGEKRRIALAHRLVAQAFLDNPELKPEVNHKNGVKLDNGLENLEWVTHAENQKHMRETGLAARGERVASSTIPKATIKELIRRYRAGEATAGLAKEYGLNRKHVWRVVTGRRWKHLQ